MTDTVKDLLGQLKAFSKEAKAATKEAQASLEGVSSMPGSENDKPIPSGATNPDPKVKDPTIDQPAERTLAGAEPGSDFPANTINETQADEAALTPDKKPLDTADANAKTAAAGNSIVEFILKTKKENAEKKAAEEAAAKEAAEKKAAEEAAAKEAAAKAAKTQPAAPAEKKAAPDSGTITLDVALMAKIAAITLADEEGQQAVQAAIAKRAGAEFAEEIFDILEKKAAEAQSQAEFVKGAQDAEALIGDLQEAEGAADAEAALGVAGDEAGAEAAMAGAEGDAPMSVEDAAAALEDYSADEIVQTVQELAEEGQLPPEQAEAVVSAVTQAAGEEGSPADISEEDVAEAILDAVDNGDMNQEQAMALVEAISQGGGDPAADQALAQDVTGAGSEGGEAAAAEEAEKAAAAKAEAEKKAAAEKRAAFKDQLLKVLKKGN